ncbi:hypothetical protein ACVBEG_27090 [Pseudomonas sp. GG8]
MFFQPNASKATTVPEQGENCGVIRLRDVEPADGAATRQPGGGGVFSSTNGSSAGCFEADVEGFFMVGLALGVNLFTFGHKAIGIFKIPMWCWSGVEGLVKNPWPL